MKSTSTRAPAFEASFATPPRNSASRAEPDASLALVVPVVPLMISGVTPDVATVVPDPLYVAIREAVPEAFA